MDAYRPNDYPFTYRSAAPVARYDRNAEIGAFSYEDASTWLDRESVEGIPNKWMLVGSIVLLTVGLGLYVARR